MAVPVHHGEKVTPPGPGPLPPINNETEISNEGDGTQASQTDKNGDFISKKEIPSKNFSFHLFKNSDEYTLKLKSEEDYTKLFNTIGEYDKNIFVCDFINNIIKAYG